MTFSIETIRHSASHVLAQAVLTLFPTAKLGIGPAIDDGYYYDFDLERPLIPEDLVQIEAEMKKIIAENQSFHHFDLSKQEAIQFMQERNQPYKVELVTDLGQDTLSFYQNNDFIDLCIGPHVESTGQIPVIKLLKISGAYWRGNEKNKMLQRIYGTVFNTQEELDTYLKRLEEAAKRDHRILGKELDLFSISDEIGGGLILWHPKGALIRHFIEDFWKKEHLKSGYQLLYTPHIGKAQLWETSGHLGFYRENMYDAMDIDGQDYYIKPMNCPFHILIYKNSLRSYRELPLRWAELGTVYRYEKSGVLHGLMRVRGFTQDDAHIICTPDQMVSEIQRVLKFCLDILNHFGFTEFKLYLSTRPQAKYVGEHSQWEDAQNALKSAIESTGINYEVDEGGGAFYGPKIDLKIQDAIGREWQCSTIQFDFNLPERFDMTYVGSDGNRHRPYMIHRALFGSIERFFGVLIEHYAGKFPTWLAPVQAKILTINDSVIPYAEQIKMQLEQANIRSEIDSSSEKIGFKIRQGIQEKVPFMLVIGAKEAEAQKIAVRSRDKGDLGVLTVDEFLNQL